MKFAKQMVATMIACLALQYFFPWWTLVIGAMAAGYFSDNKTFVSFLAGFAGVGLLWLIAAFYSDVTTNSILTEKVNRILPISSFILTTLVGGLVGGFAGMSGRLLKGVIEK